MDEIEMERRRAQSERDPTGDYLRDATWSEVAESLGSAQAEGVIDVEGRSCYVEVITCQTR